jgi:hypothetical protein
MGMLRDRRSHPIQSDATWITLRTDEPLGNRLGSSRTRSRIYRPVCPASLIQDLEQDLGRQLKLARSASARRVVADGRRARKASRPRLPKVWKAGLANAVDPPRGVSETPAT